MITLLIIAITVIVSWNCFIKSSLSYLLSFQPYIVFHKKQYYRFFSHILVHVNWEHLVFNMLTFFFIGKNVENLFTFIFQYSGHLFFVLLYISAALFSSLFSFFKNKNNKQYIAVGASGSVSAIVFSFILFEPFEKLYLMGLPIGIPAFIFGTLYIAASIYLAKRNNDSIAHEAHISGAIWGFIFPIILKPELFKNFIFQFI